MFDCHQKKKRKEGRKERKKEQDKKQKLNKKTKNPPKKKKARLYFFKSQVFEFTSPPLSGENPGRFYPPNSVSFDAVDSPVDINSLLHTFY